MVGSLEATPVLFELTVVAEAYALSYGVELVESFVLELVAEPCGGVACFIGPRHREGHGNLVDRLEGLDNLRGGHKLHTLFSCEAGQSFEELEDAGVAALEFAEGLQVHKQVEHLLLLRGVGNPAHIFVGGEGVFVPGSVGETAGDIVGELVVLQQEFELRSGGCAVDIVGRLPSEDVLCTFGDAPLEAHSQNLRGNFIGVNQLGVAEYLRCLAEEFLDFVGMELHLHAEFFRVGQRSQGVVVGFGQEFHLAGGGEFLQKVKEFGYILLDLLQGHAGE